MNTNSSDDASDMSGQSFPQSNLEEIVRSLVLSTNDLDGEGLVSFLKTLIARADDLRGIGRRSWDSFKDMIDGDIPITQDKVNADALETLYDATLIRSFLSRACKALGESLEYDVRQSLSKLQKVKSVVYSDDGSVDHYQLEPD